MSAPLRPAPPELRYLRRRSNRRVRKARRVQGLLRWGATAVVQLALAALLVFAAGRALAGLEQSSLLAFRDVEIEGAVRTPEAQILSAVEPWRGHNLLALDLAAIRIAVEDADWIESCTVKRVLPGTLRLRVHERLAGAIAIVDGQALLVDTAGTVVGPTGAGREDDLPVLRGLDGLDAEQQAERIRRGIAILARLGPVAEHAGERISELDLAQPEQVTALTERPGPELRLDPERAERNVAQFFELRGTIVEQVGELEYADLRWQDRIAVRPRPRPAEEAEPASP